MAHSRAITSRTPRMFAASAITTALIASMFGGVPAQAAEAITAAADLAVQGQLRVGQTIHVPTEGWIPADVELDATWFVDGEEVTDPAEAADPLDLTLLPDWAGRTVSVDVTATTADLDSVELTLEGGVVAELPAFPSIPTPQLPAKVAADKISSVSAGTWPNGTTLTYSFFVDGEPVADSSSNGFAFTADQIGRSASVTVTAEHPDYATVTVASDTRTIVGVLGTQTAPRISGTVRVGTKLTAVPGTFSPAATTNTYKWTVNTTVVSTLPTYTPPSMHVGKKLTLTVTSTRPSYEPVVRTTTAVKIGSGVFASAPAPKISGTAKVGATLKASVGTWSPKPTVKYQWNRNGVAIKGATKSSYKLTAGDWNKKITLTVTASKGAYATTKRVSKATASVVKSFAKTTAPKLTGTLRVGATLKATASGWSPAAKYTYQWKRSGVAIKGATKSTYRLTTADFGRTITVTVTGRKSGYTTASRSTSASKKIAAPLPVISRAGTYKVGVDIKPGTYYASAQFGCYWERRSTAGSSFSGIIANDFRVSTGRSVVTIKSTDRYFKTSSECGSWRPVVGTIASSMGNGTHVVGMHIRPGEYRTTTAGGGCYWERVSGFGGELRDIRENDYTSARTNYVRISSGDKGFTSSGCGTWKRVGN